MEDIDIREHSRLGPRGRGVREQFERAVWFSQLANSLDDPVASFRLQLAAIYSARAMVEIMLEAAEKQELRNYKNDDSKLSRKNWEAAVTPVLPHYHLIEKIRIHDFHRFGCMPPNAQFRVVFHGGPIRLTAKSGTAALIIGSNGPQAIVTGESQVKDQRPLLQNDGHFFDEVSGASLSLARILNDFLTSAPLAIANFEDQLR